MKKRARQICENCKFWDNSVQRAGAEPDTTGMCRINPPVADERDGSARWPFPEDLDWCGEWTARGRKGKRAAS